MLNEFDVLQDVARRFTTAGIPYMLTGSLAMSYYGQPRMTRDIDLVVEIQPKDIDGIVSIMSRDYYVDRNMISRAVSYQRAFNLIHNQAYIKVDCIVRKDSEYRALEFGRRRHVTVQGAEIWLVSKEDLIISKLYWARDSHSELQLRDVKNLLRTGYDAEYLDHWTKELGLGELLKECLNE